MFLHYYVVLFSRKLSAKIILSPSALSSFCLPARLSVCLSVWSGRGCPWSPRKGLLDGYVSQSVSFGAPKVPPPPPPPRVLRYACDEKSQAITILVAIFLFEVESVPSAVWLARGGCLTIQESQIDP